MNRKKTEKLPKMETFTQFPKILRIIQDYYNKKVRFNLLEHELGGSLG